MPERYGVCSHAERRAPFFCYGFGQADDTGFCQGVVCLARVAVQAGGGGDVYYVPRLAVFDAEVGGCGADEFEGLRVMQGEDCVPLFVGGLEGLVSASGNLQGDDVASLTLWITPSHV
jgi:hypothetical protein